MTKEFHAAALADDTCLDRELIETLRAERLIEALLESLRRSSPRLAPFLFALNGREWTVMPVSLPEGILLAEAPPGTARRPRAPAAG